jgi:hypothetical protein
VLYSLPFDTSGSEREPKLWPNTHFRIQPNAAAADLSLCAISSSSEREEDEMAPMYRNFCANVTMPNASSIWRGSVSLGVGV